MASTGRLANKVAVITGGARGIGEGIAARFAREGARVIVADVQEAEASALAQRLVGAGYQAAAVRCDVSKAADVEQMVQYAVDRFGALDILVANAGGQPCALPGSPTACHPPPWRSGTHAESTPTAAPAATRHGPPPPQASSGRRPSWR
jgi:NAD(P)-dependent dehydrogenase (short-subunit alcohol dehydrogenase family)